MHSIFAEINPERSTLVDILRWRAQHEPQKEAYTFLLDTTNGYLGETKQAQMTYADLDREARRIATLLQDCVAAGERVLLLYPPGLEYIAAIFGCFYAGVVAVPAYPPRPNQHLQRIQNIVQDARATAVLTTSKILSSLQRARTLMQDLEWIVTDTGVAVDARLISALREFHADPQALALLQYTSGSTAFPKGVMLTHENLIQNAALIQEGMSMTPEDRGMVWLPPYHDMGLMAGIFQALYTGYPTLLMTPAAFLQKPLRWLQVISAFKVTASGGPNFAFDLCVKHATQETIKRLDLSSWTLAFTGAEPVRAETLARFAETFAPCGFHPEAFYPCYGLAETTLFVSGGHRLNKPHIRAFDRQALACGRVVKATGDQEPGHLLVGCGHVRQGQEVAIVDPQTHTRLSPATIGEIWVRGPQIAQGYWGQAEETAETFQAFLHDTVNTVGTVPCACPPCACPVQGPFLRTGDLGFCIDNELFITGRLKDLIIIRGRNLYPQDIEQVVEKSHPLLRQGCCAVFAVAEAEWVNGKAQGTVHTDTGRGKGVGMGEQVVIVQEVVRHYDDQGVQEAIQAIRQAVLSEFDVDVAAIALLRAGTIPKTTSGKIQRHACRSRFLAGDLHVVYQWQRAEVHVREAVLSGVGPGPSFDDQTFTPTMREIIDWLVMHIAERAHVDTRAVDLHAPFVQFGLNSLEAIGLSGELEQWLGRSLSPTLIYDYPSIDALARHLVGANQPVEINSGQAKQTNAIAIIGLGCRFPGAENPAAFWQMLRAGVDAIAEVPAARWHAARFYAPDQAIPGKMNTRWGGFLHHIELFDPAFFHISPREAAQMDPQQRLLLEVAWETLEQAGQAPDKLAGSQTGVFIGISSDDYKRLPWGDPARIDAYTGTGNAHSVAANRLSYTLDLRGPSMAIDTACSSSLVAVHQACQSLRNGECDLALAGGVNVILSPELTIAFSQARMLSSDGRCKAFDATADGYVRGEGCGLVLLKPLAAALRDGDTVLAIIRGSAVNQDGRSNGLTAPNGPAQEAVIRHALQHAGISPNEISYVETHGSSTPLGDPIEVDALKNVLMKERSPDQPCLLGAVKTNIGHLEAAAGIAGLIKTVLCLQKGVIVPNLHFKTLNPHISFAGTPFEIPIQPRPWPGQPDALRFAGVSAFGFGGTNAHVILEGRQEEENRRGSLTQSTDPFKREYCWIENKESDTKPVGIVPYADPVLTRIGVYSSNLQVGREGQGQAIAPTRESLIDFGLIFFSSSEASANADIYQLVTESAKYADQHDFSSIWIPERHFTKEGQIYPNPAILLAALAKQTGRIHLRAGSVVVPLHNPLRIAEDWAMVDQLSGGRVGVSFASGWHPNDFALAPDHYADRSAVMYRNIEIVRKLWRGETVPFKGGDGQFVELKTYPSPMQHDIPIWLTAAGNPATFANAGKLGANLLTHMYNQSVDELAEKIRIYRDARAEHGYDPATGKVSVMLHTYIGADMETVRTQVQGPFAHYLQSASYLVNAIAHSRGQQADLSTLAEKERQEYLAFVTDRLIREQRVLFGTPETCALLVTQLQAAGVDEIACQMDFGIESDLVLRSLPYLNRLRELCNAKGEARAAYPVGVRLSPTQLKQEQMNGSNGSNGWYDTTRPQTIPDPSSQNEINSWLYQLRWEAIDWPQPPPSMQPGHWLIFLDKKGVGQCLAQQLQEQGHNCSLISLGESFLTIDQHHYQVHPANPQEIKQAVRTALAAVRQDPTQTVRTALAAVQQDPTQAVGTALAAVRTLPLHGVIHLWSLDTTPVEALNAASLETDQILCVQSALSLIQALVEEAVQTRLWLITQGAQPVEATDTNLAISQSPLWGLGKTCAMEHPELWGGLIDLDFDVAYDKEGICTLATVCQSHLGEDQMAMRGTKMYVSRMVRVEGRLTPDRSLRLSPDAAYLITGGLGGGGLLAASFLAMRGARHLILLGRTRLPARETWDQVPPESRLGLQIASIRSIERLGAQIDSVSADVTDPIQLAAVLAHWSKRGDNQQQVVPPIRGIVHTASVWQDAQGQLLLRPLANLDVADLMTVLRPKLLGGWLLTQLFKETPLDFFVSFSSIASLFGSGALGNYAAANEFLGVMAHYQRAHGQPAICIDWGSIAEIGIGATPEGRQLHEYWASHGIGLLSSQHFMTALEVLLPQDLARVGVLKLDWQLLRQSYPQMMRLPLVRGLVGDKPEEPYTRSMQGTGVERVAGSEPRTIPTVSVPYGQGRHAVLMAYIREQVANVLHVSADKLDTEQPLTSLGFDSLMAIELKNRIDRDLQIHLPIATLLQEPSISQLMKQVLALVPSQVESVVAQTEVQTGGTDGAQDPCLQPISHNQKALWFLSRLAPESVAYNLLYVARIQQHLDVPALQRALLMLAARYPILTSTYTLQNGEPVQQIHAHQTIPLEVKVPVSGIAANSRGLDDLKCLLLEESNRPIDLTKGPVLRLQLYQLASDDYLLGFILHHIVADFWALDLLINELSLHYETSKLVRSGIAPDRWGQADVQNADYVRWQQSMLQSEEGELHWRYWQNELASDLPVLNLPTDRPRPPVQTYKGASQSFSLSAEQAQKLRAVANEEKVTLFTLMLAAYQTLLYRYTDQDDILVGTPALGRTRSEFERIIGALTNPVVVRAKLAHNLTFKELLQQTKRSLLAALEHQDFPFPLLVERLQLRRNPSYSPIYQTLFIWDRPHTRERAGQGPALSLRPFVYGQQGAPFDLTLTVFEIDDVGVQDPHLRADFRYNVDLFDASTIARMAEHFLTLLDSIINNLDQRVRELPLMPDDVRQTLLTAWNATHRDHKEWNPWWSQEMTVHQLFEWQVEQTPEAIAVVFEDTSLTYRELNSLANHLAHRLLGEGVGPEVLVGICMERSLELVVALLAVLKAGGAYVPLDQELPQERFTFLLEDAKVSVVLTQERLLVGRYLGANFAPCPDGHDGWALPKGIFRYKTRVVGEETPVPTRGVSFTEIPTHERWEERGNPTCSVQPQNQAYMIYTSGSTGKPKGTMNTNQGLCNRLLWMQETYQLTSKDRVLQKTPFSFDVSVWEFFWPLLTGASLIMARPRGHHDPVYLKALIAEQAVSTLHFVPSMLQAFLEEQNLQDCESLRQVMCSGEVLTASLQARFFAHVTEEVKLHNLYGPTEAAIDVTFWECQRDHRDQPNGHVPIGRPIANTQIYLLDADLQLVPIGIPGELYIGGVGLARGYFNRPDLTAERFIPNPFVPHLSVGTRTGAVGTGLAPVRAPTASVGMGEHLYRTGDLARYRADGAIEFLGRIDQQVKLRGFRIELGEIEATLQAHPAVQGAVVMLYEEERVGPYLAAYVVKALSPLEGQGSDPPSTREELQSYLREQLPEYMVPTVFVYLKDLPLTLNGKVDRKALPVPERTAQSSKGYVPPQSELEQRISEIWREVLKIQERVGIYDNFFDLGGHSLLLIQVWSKLQAYLGYEMSVINLFNYPTIHALSAHLSMQQEEESLHQPIIEQVQKRKAALRRHQQRGEMRNEYRRTTY